MFKWVTGEEWSYTNWDNGTPSASDLWVYIYAQYDAKWHDETSATYNYYILCEWDYDVFTTEHPENYFLAAGYQFYNGHSFKLIYTGSNVNDAVIFSQAQAACEAMGGHLATVTSREKEYYLISLCGYEKTGSSITPFIGGQKVNDVWQWVTGEEWIYTNWYSGEPSNSCANLNSYGSWSTSRDGNLERYYLCEWDVDIRTNLEEYYLSKGYAFYNGHTFKYFSDTKTWAEAQAACEALGGHLATSTSAEKNAFLTTLTTKQQKVCGNGLLAKSGAIRTGVADNQAIQAIASIT